MTNATTARPADAMTGKWSAWRSTVASRWRALDARERRAVVIAATLLSAAIVWMIALQPALRTLRDAPAQIEALDVQLQEMRALAAETIALRGATPVSNRQTIAALEAATRQLGTSGRLVFQGDRATLNLDGVDAKALQEWLEVARSAARARPIEMQIVRGPNGYSGSLVVGLGGGGR